MDRIRIDCNPLAGERERESHAFGLVKILRSAGMSTPFSHVRSIFTLPRRLGVLVSCYRPHDGHATVRSYSRRELRVVRVEWERKPESSISTSEKG